MAKGAERSNPPRTAGPPRRPVWLELQGQDKEAGKKQGRALPRISEEAWPCGHPDFRLLISRTVRQEISVSVRPPFWGTLFQQSKGTESLCFLGHVLCVLVLPSEGNTECKLHFSTTSGVTFLQQENRFVPLSKDVDGNTYLE